MQIKKVIAIIVCIVCVIAFGITQNPPAHNKPANKLKIGFKCFIE